MPDNSFSYDRLHPFNDNRDLSEKVTSCFNCPWYNYEIGDCCLPNSETCPKDNTDE